MQIFVQIFVSFSIKILTKIHELSSLLLKMATNNECKLNSPIDWECWRQQFQSTVRSFDIWEVVKRQKSLIQKSIESNLVFYSLITLLTAQTRA